MTKIHCTVFSASVWTLAKMGRMPQVDSKKNLMPTRDPLTQAQLSILHIIMCAGQKEFIQMNILMPTSSNNSKRYGYC